MRSRVEQFAAIRRDHRVEGLSIRGLADRHRCASADGAPGAGVGGAAAAEDPARVAPRLEPFKAAIDAMLRVDLDAPEATTHGAKGFGPAGR